MPSPNPNIELVNLDFTTFKDNLKKFLSSQDKFKDYDFEGSNINVLLDLLSYNTYVNSFYLNMAISEMFLDSAQIRDSVISHAKELNYLPRSFQSSKAQVNLRITPAASVDTVTILKGTSFTTRIGSNTFSFSTDENIILTSSNAVFTANNVDIFEGDLVTEALIYRTTAEVNSLVISNPTIDTRSITVLVYEDNGVNILPYTRGTSFLGLQANSQVFFVQPSRNDRFEIVFGNGTQGREPKDGSAVVILYRTCSGELPNGAFAFAIDGPIEGHSNVIVETSLAAEGGLVSESLQSIKKNAPRAFQTQERAVTALDYKTALQIQFPEIESINVFGGEDADPPQYGRVFVSVNLQDLAGTPAFKKQIYKDYIKTITPLSIDSVFIDPEFMFLEINSTVRYNINAITTTESSLKSLVQNKIQVFNEQSLNDFGVTFRYSKLVSEIDSVDKSILSNQTSVVLYKEITPLTTQENTFVINYYNSLDNRFTAALPDIHRGQEFHSVVTTPFTFNNQLCMIADNHVGVLNVYAFSGSNHVLVRPVGTVNYSTGRIQIVNFQPSSYPPGPIRVRVRTKDNDISALRNNIIRIKPNDTNVFVVSSRDSGTSSGGGTSSGSGGGSSGGGTSSGTGSAGGGITSTPPSSPGGGSSYGY